MKPWQECPFDDIIDDPVLPHLYDDDSRWAIKAALGSGRPLLLRGEPGVGKSQLAAAAARSLHRPLVRQVVTSHTEAEEFLYHFDAVARLAKAQVLGIERPSVLPKGQEREDEKKGVAAVPRAQTMAGAALPDEPNGRLAEEVRSDPLHELRLLRPGPLWWVFDWGDAEEQYSKFSVIKGTRPSVPPAAWDWKPEHGTVLLIDELDKAEPDVPNALLEAFGERAFGVPYRSRRVEALRGAEPPLVIVTTNEERELPAAFLRRCLVLELGLEHNAPGKDLNSLLIERGKAHFGETLDHKLYEAVAELLVKERKALSDAPVRPGQAEYLDILRALRAIHPGDYDAQRQALERISRFTLRKSSDQGY